MRVVVALGGNALLKRGEPMTAENQRPNVRAAAPALAAVGEARTSSCCRTATARRSGCSRCRRRRTHDVDPYPLDVLGAQTEGMIGYVLEQELGNADAAGRAARHDADDGRRSTRPTRRSRTRPSSSARSTPRTEADALAAEKGWVVQAGRRQLAPGRALAAAAAHLRDPADPLAARPRRRAHLRRRRRGARRCSCRRRETTLVGVEAVIDKDLASELLAREVDADLFVMATDVDAVYADWGTPQQRALGRVTADELRATEFPAGSMGPKVEAACRFVEATGRRAAIGSLTQIQQIVDGEAGTQVVPGDGGAA